MMEVIERPGNSAIHGEAHDMSILWGRGEKLRLFFYPDKHEVDRQAVVESALAGISVSTAGARLLMPDRTM